MAAKSVIKGFGSFFFWLHIKDCHSKIWFFLSKSSSHIYDVIYLNFIHASENVFLPVFVKLSNVSVKLSIFPAQSGQNMSNAAHSMRITETAKSTIHDRRNEITLIIFSSAI